MPPMDAKPPQPTRGDRLSWSDEQLLAECEVHAHRTGGPGGQHRNKVSSAIRIVHTPSGVVVTASERRSQHENRAVALDRLRLALAIRVRQPLPAGPSLPANVRFEAGRLRVSAKNPAYPAIIALALDAFAHHRTQPRPAADWLGVSSSSFVRFLADEPAAWAEANRMRAELGLAALRAN